MRAQTEEGDIEREIEKETFVLLLLGLEDIKMLMKLH